MARTQLALALLALCLLRGLVPLDGRGALALIGVAALPLSSLLRERWPGVPVPLMIGCRSSVKPPGSMAPITGPTVSRSWVIASDIASEGAGSIVSVKGSATVPEADEDTWKS